jgi:hypothetical protein
METSASFEARSAPSFYPTAAAPRRVAALECVGCAKICPCAARAKHNVIVPPGPQQNAKLFLREP